MQIRNFTIGDHNREAFCMLVKALPTGQLYTGKVIEKKLARTLSQNDLYWKLVTGLGDLIGYEKDEMHQLLGYKFLSYEKNGETFIKSTTKLNTAEFSEYFAKCERFAAECGFILDSVRF